MRSQFFMGNAQDTVTGNPDGDVVTTTQGELPDDSLIPGVPNVILLGAALLWLIAQPHRS